MKNLASISNTLSTADLLRLQQILKSTKLDQTTPGDDSWQPVFIEVIILLDSLLNQSQQLNHRIDFTAEVGVNGKVQDITSLVNWMRYHMPTSTALLPNQSLKNRLNRYQNAGGGYFANGVLFRCDHDGEMAFYLDNQRIYLNRHIRRALEEVEPN